MTRKAFMESKHETKLYPIRGYRMLQVPASQPSDAETTPLGLQTLGKACQRSTTVERPVPHQLFELNLDDFG